MIYLIIVLAILAALVAILYNSLVRLRNKVNEAWSDIDTQLKRRYDLIPNLVETVKGYAGHESQTLEKVIQARNMAMNAQSVQEKEQAENMISGALKTIFALSENYPELKANQNFMDLQKTLKEVEEHLQMSRRYYNGTVRDFNNKIEVFPNNLVAKPLGFTQKEFFQATEAEKGNVKVDFSNKSDSDQTPPATPAPQTPPTPPAPSAAPGPKPPAPETPSVDSPSSIPPVQSNPQPPAPEVASAPAPSEAPTPPAPQPEETPAAPSQTPPASTDETPKAPSQTAPEAPTQAEEKPPTQ